MKSALNKFKTKNNFSLLDISQCPLNNDVTLLILPIILQEIYFIIY